MALYLLYKRYWWKLFALLLVVGRDYSNPFKTFFSQAEANATVGDRTWV